MHPIETPRAADGVGEARPAWQAPAFELIELGCEITAYAPAGDEPLF
jgi:coenzyme PQQ precursor peptide PqqA